MPVDSTYQKYYGALQQAYGKDGTVEKGAFNLGYDDFKQKLSNQDYAQKIYGALDQAYGKQGVAEKGAFTLPFKDFYSKLTAPTTATTIQPPSTNLVDQSLFKTPRQATESTPSIHIPTPTGQTMEEAHATRVQKAANNITQTFNDNKDKAIVNIISTDLSQKQKQLDAAYQDGQIDEKAYKDQKKQLFGQMMNPGAAVSQFKQDMATDQGKIRKVVSEIAKANPTKANQIKADMYVLDSKDRPQKAAKILSNTANIEKGDTDYNIRDANLANHEGFFSSVGQGFSERNRMMNDYDFYTGETPDKIIGKLEHQRNSYDPDEPVNAPYGIGGHLGQAIGSQGVVTAKGAASGALTSLIPAVGEAAAPWVAAAVTSPEFYKTGYVSSLENEYHRLRNQGIPEDEALQKAKDKAEFDAKIDVAQGVLATAVGTRIGLKPTELPPTFQKSITNIAKHAGTWLGETGVEGGANAIIAGGLQELKNIHAGRPAEEGAFETGMGQLMFAYGLGALTKGGRVLLNPKAYGSILRTMAKAPEEKTSAELANMVRSGSISAEDATDVHTQLTQQRTTDSRIPDHITNDKDRAKIQELIGQRDELDAKLENLDKAYHPDIKEQIKGINEKIADLSKNPTEPTRKPSTEPTFKEPEDQTRLYVNDQIQKGNKEWTKNDIYVNMAKQDPEGFIKFVADQSTPETREHTEDIFGKEMVQKAIDLYHPKTEEHGKDQGRADEAQANQGQITQQEGAANAPSFEPTSWARTLDYGENKGKEENESAKQKIEEQILKDEPIGGNGERFSQLLGRVIPGIQKTMAEDPHNTTVVTHSSVIKVLKVWEEMGRPDISELHGEKLKEFAQKYVDLKPEAEGKVHTFKAENGNEIKVVRHGETEDNKLSEFREDNTQLTDKGIAQAKKAGENLAKETGANVPKIIYSDLPRTEHTTNLISDVLKEKQGEYPKITNVKLKENALQERRPEEVLQREPEQTGSAGGERTGVEPGQQGNEPSGAHSPEEEGKSTSEENIDELPFGRLPIGIAHHLQEERARAELNVAPPERGEGITLEQSIQRGKDLIAAWVNPDEVSANFKKDNRLSSDDMAVVRARYNELAQRTNKAYDEYGEGSPQANAAFTAERAWYNDAVKPMQTEWSKIGTAQQSSVDLDTETITSIKRAFQEQSGRPLTEQESQKAKEFHDKIKEKDKTISDLHKKLDAIINSNDEAGSKSNIKANAKAIAKRIREKAKFNRPDSFSLATPASLVWDSAVEVVAKAIEVGGTIAEAVEKGLEHIRATDWYKGLSADKQQKAEKQFSDWHNKVQEKSPEEIKIERLEKELADLQQGKARQKGPATEDSPRAKELKDQIAEAKKNLGLIRSKEEKPLTPEQETEEREKEREKTRKDLAGQFVDKKDNTFTDDQVKGIWGWTKGLIDDGETNFHNAIHQTAMDLGLSPEQVIRAVSQPKGTKKITDAIYAQMYHRNNITTQARIWVKSADQSWPKRFFNSIIKYPAAVITFGHGSVAPITHVGSDLYRPTNWKSYFNFMLNSYKYSFGGLSKSGIAKYERAMSGLVRDPYFMMAKKAGLKVDPTDKFGDDYSAYAGILGRISKMGNRGFNAMKPYRLEQFKKLYNNLSNEGKANADVVKAIAHSVNLATGTTDYRIPEGADLLLFAPKLVASQYQRILVEPIKAVGTIATWKNTSDAAKLKAKIVGRHSGEMVGTYLAMLAANQAILSMMGSKQQINFTNPINSDWMKFKAGGKDVDASGGMHSALTFIAALVKEGLRANGIIKTTEKQKPGDVEGKKILQQESYKLSPAGSDIKEFFSGTDMMGNPLPWSAVKPSKGTQKLGWDDYFEAKLPIPMADGIKNFKEGAKSQGMSKDVYNNLLESIIVGILTGTTGAHIGEDYSLQKGGGTTGGGGAGGNFKR